ncbi:MAG: glycosyltransferase [Actinomycetales bacterium]
MRALLLRADPALCRHHGCVSAPTSLVTATQRALVAAGPCDVTLHTIRPGSGGAASGSDFPALVRQFTESGAPPADVVHAYDLVSAAVALSAGRTAGWAVVVRAQLAGGPMSPTGQTLWPVVLRAADLVLVPTTADATFARSLGAPPSRLMSCSDAALLAAEEASTEEPGAGSVAAVRDGVPDDGYVLGLSGAPADPRTRAQLIRALKARPQLRLVLAGPSTEDRTDRRLLSALADRHRVADRLDLVGRASVAEMVRLVRDSCAVVATRSDPTSALAALVAMHCAKPVVGVRSAALSDIQIDGVTGRVVDPARLAAALDQTVHDRFRQVAWGMAGLDRVWARYAPEVVTRSLLGAYDRVA